MLGNTLNYAPSTSVEASIFTSNQVLVGCNSSGRAVRRIPLTILFSLNSAFLTSLLSVRLDLATLIKNPSVTQNSLAPVLEFEGQLGRKRTFAWTLLTKTFLISVWPDLSPPKVLISSIEHCFQTELKCVDFPGALAGLDNLTAFESLRKRQVARANSGELEHVDRVTSNDPARPHVHCLEASTADPSIQSVSQTAELLFTMLHKDLRRWVSIQLIL